MKLKDIGKSLMLPIAIFPLAAILMGIGHAIEKIRFLTVISVLLISLGEVVVNYMPYIFAVGVSYGLCKNKKSFAAINGLLSYLIVISLLSMANVSTIQNDFIIGSKNAFSHINNQFIGIFCGILSTYFFEKGQKSNAFFDPCLMGMLCSTISMMFVSIIIFYVWPVLYEALIYVGVLISKSKAAGAGIYGFLNRLLVPLGMHHVLNSLFWFDVIGINDIGNFWTSKGIKGVTGMYQAGFYPIMMFAMPAVALAIYKTSFPKNRKRIKPYLISAVIATFFSGVTEPLEFCFMFLSPALYFLHAVLSGIVMYIAAKMEWIAGFTFSAGIIDYIFSFQMPLASKPWMLLVLGVVVFIVYYVLFSFLIVKFNIPVMGREPENFEEKSLLFTTSDIDIIIKEIIDICGGTDNILGASCCLTRLRVEVKDKTLIRKKIKAVMAVDYVVFGNELQFVYGYQVEKILKALEEYI